MSTNSVKNDNRRALPKFLIILLISGILGGAVGFFLAASDGMAWGEAVLSALNIALPAISPWGIPAATLVMFLPAVILFLKTKKLVSHGNMEDEKLLDRVNVQLDFSILLLSLLMPLNLLFLSMAVIYGMDSLVLLVVVVELILSFVGITLLQQRVVDLTRAMNPEKQGSIYDPKFQEKWVSSCDEAERKQIGEAAFHAFRMTNTACAALWLLLFFAHTVFQTGLLPIFVVLLLWAILQGSYILFCIKLDKHGT